MLDEFVLVEVVVETVVEAELLVEEPETEDDGVVEDREVGGVEVWLAVDPVVSELADDPDEEMENIGL